MESDKNFVSRAGDKLQFALHHFSISVKDLVCADFGSSTGGFVDCLLQNGASKVYSVDTSYGELAWKLRNNPQVVVMERTNALHVALPEQVDFISIDTGWTRQELVIPNALKNLKSKGKLITLLKPHYEAEKKDLIKGLVPEEILEDLVKTVIEKLKLIPNTEIVGYVKSPILGARGKNTEFLVFISKT